LYELLSGRLPHDSDDPARLAMLAREATPAALQSVAADAPPDVSRLVHACLAKDPLRRPQTPAELVERLVRLEFKYFAV
jgi:serine/threonine-protein kinase